MAQVKVFSLGGIGSPCCCGGSTIPCDPGGGCNDGPARFCTFVYIHGGVTSSATVPTGCFGGVSHGGGLAIFDGGCGGDLVGPGFRFEMGCYSGPPNHMGILLCGDSGCVSPFASSENCPPSGGLGCVSGFSGSCSPYSMEWDTFDFTGVPGGSGATYIGYTFLSITYTD